MLRGFIQLFGERMNSPNTTQTPLVSVVAVNYNCKKWLDRFFPSIQAQTIFDRIVDVSDRHDGHMQLHKSLTAY